MAVNTHYPEVFGEYYFNKRILKVIGDALETLGIWFCLPDTCGGDIIPAEDAVSLRDGENYVLVDAAGKTEGGVLVWEAWEGGPSADDAVLDFRLPFSLSSRFEEALRDACDRSEIKMERLPDAPYAEFPRPSLLRKMWRSFKRRYL